MLIEETVIFKLFAPAVVYVAKAGLTLPLVTASPTLMVNKLTSKIRSAPTPPMFAVFVSLPIPAV